ncbi:hypothetical protein [Streptomyces yatensis]|uniref:hypothetical protein n=1 Tax=Streptomyces yatensis TaxID=155177 RepID=UPI001B3C7690|nr:hypothetical protein [Streptomyces yatensis]
MASSVVVIDWRSSARHTRMRSGSSSARSPRITTSRAVGSAPAASRTGYCTTTG